MTSKLQANNQHQTAVQFRVIVVGIVQNELGEYLICKMPKGRGVFPDQWGLPGGGIEEGEMMEADDPLLQRSATHPCARSTGSAVAAAGS